MKSQIINLHLNIQKTKEFKENLKKILNGMIQL